jgi:hypothetical protein
MKLALVTDAVTGITGTTNMILWAKASLALGARG